MAPPAAMRILILTPRLPWPPVDGGRIAMSRLAESLARAGAEVEILSLNPRKDRASIGSAPLPVQAVDIDTSRFVLPLRAPFVVSRFISAEFRDALRAKLRAFRPDVVQIESPFLLPYLSVIPSEGTPPHPPSAPSPPCAGEKANQFNAAQDSLAFSPPRGEKVPKADEGFGISSVVEGPDDKHGAMTVLRSHNVEFRIWETLADHERNPLRRFALRRVAASLRRYEVRHLNTPDAIVPITAADAEELRRLGCTRPMHVAPCGVELQNLGGDPEPNTAGFIGSLDFRPNQETAKWLVDELWPRVLKRMPEAKLLIAGKSPVGEQAFSPVKSVPDRRGRLSPHWNSIEFLGQVPDADAFMRRMSVILAPLFAGGGMRIKVLEAMALGRPVVATALGAGGIEFENGCDIVIAEDADSFADAVVRLLRDPESAARIGSAAREKVASRYDSDAIGRELLSFYQSLDATRRG